MSITIADCEKILPQTQCRECGYNGCNPYATALVEGKEKSIGKCRPGGVGVMEQLAELLHLPKETPRQQPLIESTLFVHVDMCIGCTLCIQACPVDAILGAPKLQHQIIEEYCTGCRLCIPQCPTECIEIIERKTPMPSADQNKRRYEERLNRIEAKNQSRMLEHHQTVKKLQDPSSILAMCLKKKKDSGAND